MNKKKDILGFLFIFLQFLLILSFGCKKDDSKLPIPSASTITDIDGNVYHFVTIGTQIWMVENLKTTKYRNGDPISFISDSTVWSNMLIGAYCDYNNVSGYSTIYGKLYNWYAVKDSRNIAPIGWHIPSDVEFITLSNYLGGDIEAPNKLKEIGTSHWQSPNTGATNVSGFTALPGGMRQGESGYFEGIVSGGYWWCITEYQYDPNMAVNRCLYSSANNCFLRNYTWKKDGLSIRCIKD